MRVKRFIAVALDEDNNLHLFEPTEEGLRQINDDDDLGNPAHTEVEHCDDLDHALELVRAGITEAL